MKNFQSFFASVENIFIVVFGIIILLLLPFQNHFALGVSRNFWMFFGEMIIFLPFLFILIGLIDVWFPKELVEKHIGGESGLKGVFWMMILAMFQAGPLYGAFPVCYLLWKKGGSIRNIFIYLGAFSTIKIPMLTFETGFLGWKFSLLRTALSLPVFIVIALLMEACFKNKKFEVKQPEGRKKGG